VAFVDAGLLRGLIQQTNNPWSHGLVGLGLGPILFT